MFPWASSPCRGGQEKDELAGWKMSIKMSKRMSEGDEWTDDRRRVRVVVVGCFWTSLWSRKDLHDLVETFTLLFFFRFLSGSISRRGKVGCFPGPLCFAMGRLLVKFTLLWLWIFFFFSRLFLGHFQVFISLQVSQYFDFQAWEGWVLSRVTRPWYGPFAA